MAVFAMPLFFLFSCDNVCSALILQLAFVIMLAVLLGCCARDAGGTVLCDRSARGLLGRR
jgi:hypothetical protein